MANYSGFSLYLIDEHFETIARKIGPFLPVWPCRGKNLTFDLFFNNYGAVRRRYVKLYFFWIVITRGIWWNDSRQHWNNFWIWPLYKLSCDPQASCTGCDPTAIWNGDPWTHTNIMKLSNLLFLFSWENFRSFRPICEYSIIKVGQT